MKKTCLILLWTSLIFSANVLAKEVFLECIGNFTYCVIYDKDAIRCDSPKKDIVVISIDGNSISQIDGRGFLSFKTENCESSEIYIECFDPQKSGTTGSADEESGKRTLNIARTSGVVSWLYETRYGPQNPRIKNAAGMIGMTNKYEGQCKIRENKNLF
jgi:hypothetical protein